MPYHGRALDLLNAHHLQVGDRITIRSQTETIRSQTGTIMPRYHGSDDSHITLKLDNGYNVGISIADMPTIRIHDSPPAPAQEEAPPRIDPDLPHILLLSTGGTIASRIDYRTGAVTPALDATHLGGMIQGMVNITPVSILSEYSENITPQNWLAMAEAIHKMHHKYDGVIVAHGTDTMHYTAAFLSFALAGCDKPIILTGSQRSTDRASSDAVLNMQGAIGAIAGGIHRGVYVAMHHTDSDDVIAIHPGGRVRKNHTSSRAAFQTAGGPPTYMIQDGRLESTQQADYWHGAPYNPKITVSKKASLIKYYPGYDTGMMQHVADTHDGVILEGTGLGHVGRQAYDVIRGMIRRGMFVGMTSQCIHGRVRMTVYESGRDLLELGVVPLYMTPETALVKAMWALSTGMDMYNVMPADLASETLP